jgi:hypothetical protein
VIAFDWNAYFVLAEELAKRDDEASKRTAISRAYYSAFHDAMARAETTCGPKDGGNSHDWCWNRYLYTDHENCKKVGIEGNRLKGKRVWADYNAEPQKRLADYVTAALDTAQRLKKEIASLSPENPTANLLKKPPQP